MAPRADARTRSEPATDVYALAERLLSVRHRSYPFERQLTRRARGRPWRSARTAEQAAPGAPPALDAVIAKGARARPERLATPLARACPRRPAEALRAARRTAPCAARGEPVAVAGAAAPPWLAPRQPLRRRAVCGDEPAPAEHAKPRAAPPPPPQRAAAARPRPPRLGAEQRHAKAQHAVGLRRRARRGDRRCGGGGRRWPPRFQNREGKAFQHGPWRGAHQPSQRTRVTRRCASTATGTVTLTTSGLDYNEQLGHAAAHPRGRKRRVPACVGGARPQRTPGDQHDRRDQVLRAAGALTTAATRPREHPHVRPLPTGGNIRYSRTITCQKKWPPTSRKQRGDGGARHRLRPQGKYSGVLERSELNQSVPPLRPRRRCAAR